MAPTSDPHGFTRQVDPPHWLTLLISVVAAAAPQFGALVLPWMVDHPALGGAWTAIATFAAATYHLYQEPPR